MQQSEVLTDLYQSNTTLLMLHILRHDHYPVPRPFLEGMASLAKSKICREDFPRLFADYLKNDRWQKPLYESIAHLETNRCILPATEGYFITANGEKRLGKIKCTAEELTFLQWFKERTYVGLKRYGLL